MSKIILTTHAVERMWQRRISQNMIEKTVQKPDGKKPESDGDTQFYRTMEGRKVHAVAKPIERGDWLIKTVWVDNEDNPNLLWKIVVAVAVRLLRR